MKVLSTEDLYNDRELTARLTAKIKEFESRVWFAGLQDQILSTRCRGISGKMGSLLVMTYTMAGRTMITIERLGVQVSCVADETSKESRTGLQGVHGTEEDVIGLINWVIHWYGCGMLQFQEDKSLGIC